MESRLEPRNKFLKKCGGGNVDIEVHPYVKTISQDVESGAASIEAVQRVWKVLNSPVQAAAFVRLEPAEVSFLFNGEQYNRVTLYHCTLHHYILLTLSVQV